MIPITDAQVLSAVLALKRVMGKKVLPVLEVTPISLPVRNMQEGSAPVSKTYSAIGRYHYI